VAALLSAGTAHGQGTFENFDFEWAALYLTPVPAGQFGGEVPLSSGLPGWSASINDVPVTQVLQNNITLGGDSIDIIGPNWNSLGPGIIDGSYSVFLQANNTGQGNVSIWEEGTVPGTAESLQFKAWESLPSALFSVSFAGNNLPLVAISSGTAPSGQAYTVYGANVTPYASQNGQLEFTAEGGNGPSWIELDDITFSPQAIPEPNPFVLTGLGGVLYALYRRFAAKRK
jgi:hypothetical protein